jgi:hypothetical protein
MRLETPTRKSVEGHPRNLCRTGQQLRVLFHCIVKCSISQNQMNGNVVAIHLQTQSLMAMFYLQFEPHQTSCNLPNLELKKKGARFLQWVPI